MSTSAGIAVCCPEIAAPGPKEGTKNDQGLTNRGKRCLESDARLAQMKTQASPARPRVPALQIKKILVPSDFSVSSNRAFRYSLELARQFGADLVLMHVFEPAPGPGLNGNGATEREDVLLKTKNLRAWATLAKTEGIATKVAVRNGLATHEIVEGAKELDTDLVVIGTHGHTGWKHFCLGSTAERVVRAAPCPVLVVREKEHELA